MTNDNEKARRIGLRAKMDVKVICTGNSQYEWVDCTMEDFKENTIRKRKFEMAEKRMEADANFIRGATLKEQMSREGLNETFD